MRVLRRRWVAIGQATSHCTLLGLPKTGRSDWYQRMVRAGAFAVSTPAWTVCDVLTVCIFSTLDTLQAGVSYDL